MICPWTVFRFQQNLLITKNLVAALAAAASFAACLTFPLTWLCSSCLNFMLAANTCTRLANFKGFPMFCGQKYNFEFLSMDFFFFLSLPSSFVRCEIWNGKRSRRWICAPKAIYSFHLRDNPIRMGIDVRATGNEQMQFLPFVVVARSVDTQRFIFLRRENSR